MKKIILFSALTLCLSSCLKTHIDQYGIGIDYISHSSQNFDYAIHYWINGTASIKTIHVTPQYTMDSINTNPYDKFCIAFPEVKKYYTYIQEKDIPISNFMHFSLDFDTSNKLSDVKIGEVNKTKLTEVQSCETK